MSDLERARRLAAQCDRRLQRIVWTSGADLDPDVVEASRLARDLVRSLGGARARERREEVEARREELEERRSAGGPGGKGGER